MHVNRKNLKGLLALDQVSEGLEYKKFPSNYELILSHIVLCKMENSTATPKELVKISGCNAESLRLILRKTEKDGLIETSDRPTYEIRPKQVLLSAVESVCKDWIKKYSNDFDCNPPNIKEVFTMTQAFDVYVRMTKKVPFIFYSPTKRGISLFLSQKAKSKCISMGELRNLFPVDHETLRVLINGMSDLGLITKLRCGRFTCVTPEQNLIDIIDDIASRVCRRLNANTCSHQPYIDFVRQLQSDVAFANVAE